MKFSLHGKPSPGIADIYGNPLLAGNAYPVVGELPGYQCDAWCIFDAGGAVR